MKYLFILFLCTFSVAQAQIENRVMVKGEIKINDTEANIDDIEVYNVNSAQGTTTDRNGEFLLPMEAGDKVQVSSVQFQMLTVEINKGVIDNQKLTVRVSEGTNVTELEEVVVQPYNLSGDVRADVAKIKTENIGLIKDDSKSLAKDPDKGYEDDKYSKVENASMQSNMLKNGLNFANIFRTIFKKNNTTSMSSRDMTEYLRKAYNDGFFKEYLDIEKDQIPNFIYYIEDQGLTDDLLQKNNRLEFIQFLIDKSEEFKKQRN